MPSFSPNANAVSKAWSPLSSARMISTSGISGAGLKKCMPTTRSGVDTADAISVTDSADAVIATNTSALSVTEIAAGTSNPERIVGMHFFNPAPLMPLVEIIRAELSSDHAFETAYAFGEKLGKHPIRCYDTPGFVVNRVLIPLLNDCIRVLDEARVTAEDLDTGMKHGAGWPMGPCELVDLVGIDVHVHASDALYAKLREPRMAPPPRLVAMRNAGLLGRKSGRGFYTYD